MPDPACYAEVKWVTPDVVQAAKDEGFEMTEAQAHGFLLKYEDDIRDRMTERGWDVIRHFMRQELQEGGFKPA